MLIAVASFALSFEALRDLARLAGQPGSLTWLWPLVVDGSIAQATVAVVALASRPGAVRQRLFFWGVLAVAAGVSVAGNALHALVNTATVLAPMQAAGVAMVAPVALLAATHGVAILMRPAPAVHHGAPETPAAAPGDALRQGDAPGGEPVHHRAPAGETVVHEVTRTARYRRPGDPVAVQAPATVVHQDPPRLTVVQDGDAPAALEAGQGGAAGHGGVQQWASVAETLAHESGRDPEIVEQVLTLRHTRQLSHRAIAEQADVSPSTVTRILQDARRVAGAAS